MIGAEEPLLLGERGIEHAAGLDILAAGLLDETEHLLQPGAHRRRRAQQLERPPLRPGEELSDRHAIAVRTHRRVDRLKQIDQHADDLLGRVPFDLRHAPLLGQHARLPRRDDAERRKARHDDRRRGDGNRVTPDELRQAVSCAVRTREHRQPLEPAAQIVAQRVDRRVALGRALLERLEDNRVEVAAHDLPRSEAVVVDALGGAGSVSRIAVSSAPLELRRIL